MACRRTRTCLLTLPVALALFACKPEQDTVVKSFLGIQAGADPAVRDGKTPTFNALTDWFNSFTVSLQPGLRPTPRSVEFGTIQRDLDPQYRPGLIAYLDQQLQRTADFKAALALQGDEGATRLRQLIALEAAEMYDIIMVILNERYQPATKDLFARFLSLSRKTPYVSRFARDFESRILGTRLLAEIQVSLAVELRSYEDFLRVRYVGSAEARRRLAADLDRNEATLRAMKATLTGGDAGDAFALQGGMPVTGNGNLTGLAAAFMQYQNGFLDYGADRQANQAPGTPPRLEIMAAVPDNPTTECGGGSGGPIGPPPGAVAPNVVVPDAAAMQPPPGSPMAGAPGAGCGSDPGTPPPGGARLGSGWGGGGQGWGGLLGMVPANWYQEGLNLTGDRPELAMILPGKPVVDCLKMQVNGRNLTGADMVTCQRYYAYSSLKSGGGWKVRPSQGFNLQGPGGGAGNLEMVYDRPVPGKDQGSTPSCTAYSLASVAETAAQTKKKGITLDPESLWSQQGQQTYMNASLEAAAQVWSGQGVTLASENALDSEDQMVAALDRGDPVYVGVDLAGDWTSDGGGDEFKNWGLTGMSGKNVTCASGGPGHAISIKGYANVGGRRMYIVQNSWGEDWGEQGYAYLDWTTCQDSASVYAPTWNVQ